MTFQEKLFEYANLLVSIGVDIQDGQSLVINAPVGEAELVRMITKAAYHAGCARIYYTWTDNELDKLRLLHAADSTFDEYPQWQADMLETVSREEYSRISVVALEPELFNGADMSRVLRASAAERKATAGYSRRQSAGDFPWCLCAAPSPGWARLMFPNMTCNEGRNALWDVIFDATRVGNANAVELWKAHRETLVKRCETLDSMKLESLHYVTGLGTNLTVKLPAGHYWLGGNARCTSNGRLFFPNIPTEEVFTVPYKYGVNGTIVASRPLVLGSDVVEGIRFTLKQGKIVDVHADRNEARLISELDTDEGGRFLGEAALVPFDSPLNKDGRVYYHTLFDENVASHFAFGHAYPVVHGAEHMNDAQLEAAGINISSTHTDFMVGTRDMCVTGTTQDGRSVTLMENGIFVI